jgi:hypothetical protein
MMQVKIFNFFFVFNYANKKNTNTHAHSFLLIKLIHTAQSQIFTIIIINQKQSQTTH